MALARAYRVRAFDFWHRATEIQLWPVRSLS